MRDPGGELAHRGELRGVEELHPQLLAGLRALLEAVDEEAVGEPDAGRDDEEQDHQSQGHHPAAPVHVGVGDAECLPHHERPRGLAEPGVADQESLPLPLDLAHAARFVEGWDEVADLEELAPVRVDELEAALPVDDGRLHRFAAPDGPQEHVELVGVEGRAEDPGAVFEGLPDGDGEVGLVPEAKVDVADVVVLVLAHQELEPLLVAVVLAEQIGEQPGVAGLDAVAVQETDVGEGVALLAQAVEVAVHPLLGGRRPEVPVVEQAEDVEDPLLEKEIDGVLLAVGEGLEADATRVLEGVGELVLEEARRRRRTAA